METLIYNDELLLSNAEKQRQPPKTPPKHNELQYTQPNSYEFFSPPSRRMLNSESSCSSKTPPLSPGSKNSRKFSSPNTRVNLSPSRGLRLIDTNIVVDLNKKSPLKSPGKSLLSSLPTQQIAEILRSPEKFPLQTAPQSMTISMEIDKENANAFKNLSINLFKDNMQKEDGEKTPELLPSLGKSDSSIVVVNNDPLSLGSSIIVHSTSVNTNVSIHSSPVSSPLNSAFSASTLTSSSASQRRHRRARSEEPGIITSDSEWKRSRETASTKVPSKAIPQFYFPKDSLATKEKEKSKLQQTLLSARSVFGSNGVLTIANCKNLCSACGLPACFSGELFESLDSQNKGTVTFAQFARFWSEFTAAHPDNHSRTFALLSKSGEDLIPSDFLSIIFDIIKTHPGLEFLQGSPQFQERYVETIIIRIFYTIDRARRGKISLKDYKKSNLLQVLFAVESAADVNEITDYFSYKHFYVLYCRFWELDKEHKGIISKRELIQHDDGSVSTRMLDRILRGHGRLDKDNVTLRGNSTVRSRAKAMQMNYEDFCWFLLSEEDKTTETAIEYWFRLLDMDSDGIISLFELEFFYEEQMLRLRQMQMESLSFEDSICQIIDYINPKNPPFITVNDIKKSKLSTQFFNALFNFNKFIIQESKDPSTIRLERERPPMSDWNRYAEEEYDIMAAAEAAQANEEEEDEDEDEENARRGGLFDSLSSSSSDSEGETMF